MKEYTYRTVSEPGDPLIRIHRVYLSHDHTPDYNLGRMPEPPRVQFNFEMVNPSPDIFEILNNAALAGIPLALIPVEPVPEHVHEVRSDTYTNTKGEERVRTWCATPACDWTPEPQR